MSSLPIAPNGLFHYSSKTNPLHRAEKIDTCNYEPKHNISCVYSTVVRPSSPDTLPFSRSRFIFLLCSLRFGLFDQRAELVPGSQRLLQLSLRRRYSFLSDRTRKRHATIYCLPKLLLAENYDTTGENRRTPVSHFCRLITHT